MDNNDPANFQRKIVGERVMLMLPFNVVFVGRVQGTVAPSEVSAALERLRSRHPLLSVRAQIEDDGTGAFTSQGVPPIQVHMEPREREDQWLARIKDELRTPFPMESGPLVRTTLILSESTCDIILCAHHAICDGMSLGYLLRDLLECLVEPKKKLTRPVVPPPINRSTVVKPPSTSALQRFMLGLINKKWAARGIQFSWSDMHRLHEEFWRHNSGMQILASDFSRHL